MLIPNWLRFKFFVTSKFYTYKFLYRQENIFFITLLKPCLSFKLINESIINSSFGIKELQNKKLINIQNINKKMRFKH